MWIRNEEDLRAHLDNPASREGHAFEYKGAIDRDPSKGRGADFASSVGSLANADGGQVLLGVREKDGAPDKVVGVGKLEAVGKDIEDSISNFLVGIEPRPSWQALKYDADTTVIVVDVLPSVRLVAYWNTGEREKIMYPVRTGDRLMYMRPGDVEARVLAYGPRAQRIVLEQLLREAETDETTVYSSNRQYTPQGPGRVVTQLWHHGPARIEEVAAFGIRLEVTHEKQKETTEFWIPHDWITAFLTRQGWRTRGTLSEYRVGLVLRATLLPPGNGTKIQLSPPPG
ncbi:MAG: AlbA family DNA-binding domain-containing protein [Nannocystales bacterium]